MFFAYSCVLIAALLLCIAISLLIYCIYLKKRGGHDGVRKLGNVARVMVIIMIIVVVVAFVSLFV